MQSSARNIRKRNKTRFYEIRSSRRNRSRKIERSADKDHPRRREPAIFALRLQRTQAREARLALCNGQRLPPYICILRRRRTAAPRIAHPAQVTIAPAWPTVNPELELVD